MSCCAVDLTMTEPYGTMGCADPQDHDKMASLLKTHFGITLEQEEVSFKGWNWGITDFRGEAP